MKHMFQIKTLRGFIKEPYGDKYDILDATLCPRGGEEFHHRACIERECEHCGVHFLEEKLHSNKVLSVFIQV